MKYDDCGEVKEVRILKEIVPEWKQLAICLGFSNSEIRTIDMSSSYQAKEAASKMIGEWMSKDVNSTWRKLIRKMREVELNVLANILVAALKNRK